MEKIINWNQVKGYFRIMTDKEDEKEIIDSVSKGITFHGANLWIHE